VKKPGISGSRKKGFQNDHLLKRKGELGVGALRGEARKQKTKEGNARVGKKRKRQRSDLHKKRHRQSRLREGGSKEGKGIIILEAFKQKGS